MEWLCSLSLSLGYSKEIDDEAMSEYWVILATDDMLKLLVIPKGKFKIIDLPTTKSRLCSSTNGGSYEKHW